MNRHDFQQLTNLRIAEAKILLDNMYAGAYYLAGYAVECALKACIAKQVRRHEFPPKPNEVRGMYLHDLTALLQPAGLKGAHDTEIRSNLSFERNWNVVKDWSEETRYNPAIGAAEATALYNAIVARGNGVLPWIKRYW